MSIPGSNGPPVVLSGSVDYDNPIQYNALIPYDGVLGVARVRRSLGDLREEMMVRLGYAAMLANPPPGMVQELNSYLQDAQEQLYWRYDVLHTEQWWQWVTVPGARYYDTPSDGLKQLNYRKITWAGVEDNGIWYTLREGIDPLSYTVDYPGYPTHYELREYLEIWPSPQKAYTIQLKGHFGLEKFTEDTDRVTIDGHVVFLFALANAKNHRGQPDAQAYAQMAERMIREYVAGSHGTRRYIPRPSTGGMKHGMWHDNDRGPWSLPFGTWRT